MQPHIFLPGAQFKKRIDHRLYIFDRCQTNHRTNVHPVVLWLQGNLVEPLILHAIRDHDALFSCAAHLDLGAPRIGKQTGDTVGAAVNFLRQHIEKPYPAVLEGRHDPLGTDDFLLALAGVDAMLCQKNRCMVHTAAQAGKQTAVACGNGVIDLRLRYLSTDQIQNRQQHRPHGMKRIGVGNIRVLLLADLGKQAHEFAALQ